jgi:hypothetical protein
MNDDTTLTFNNQTECGTAQITVENTETGNLEEYTLEEGKEIKIKIDYSIPYRYEVQYGGQPENDVRCDAKSGTVMVPERGQNANFQLQSVTPTPQAE